MPKELNSLKLKFEEHNYKQNINKAFRKKYLKVFWVFFADSIKQIQSSLATGLNL